MREPSVIHCPLLDHCKRRKSLSYSSDPTFQQDLNLLQDGSKMSFSCHLRPSVGFSDISGLQNLQNAPLATIANSSVYFVLDHTVVQLWQETRPTMISICFRYNETFLEGLRASAPRREASRVPGGGVPLKALPSTGGRRRVAVSSLAT